MKKPTPVKQLVMKYPDESLRYVYVCAVHDIMNELVEAECTNVSHNEAFNNFYLVRIHPMYDFNEVIEWIKSLG